MTRFESDVWGQDLNSTFGTAPTIDRYRTGKFFDPATGLYYLGARWYHPALGRFIAESPLAPFGEEEYVYCHNNPVNFVDLDGEHPLLVAAGVGALAGAGVELGYQLLFEDEVDWGQVGLSGAAGATFGMGGKLLAPFLGKLPYLRPLALFFDDAGKIPANQGLISA
jgi:RHS repeat-associated protein